jgi:hypothetical protein
MRGKKPRRRFTTYLRDAERWGIRSTAHSVPIVLPKDLWVRVDLYCATHGQGVTDFLQLIMQRMVERYGNELDLALLDSKSIYEALRKVWTSARWDAEVRWVLGTEELIENS